MHSSSPCYQQAVGEASLSAGTHSLDLVSSTEIPGALQFRPPHGLDPVCAFLGGPPSPSCAFLLASSASPPASASVSAAVPSPLPPAGCSAPDAASPC